MISLHVKFQPSSTPPSDRFWWGVLVVDLLVVVLLLLVTGVKQSQLLVLRLRLECDNTCHIFSNITNIWRCIFLLFFFFLLVILPDRSPLLVFSALLSHNIHEAHSIHSNNMSLPVINLNTFPFLNKFNWRSVS